MSKMTIQKVRILANKFNTKVLSKEYIDQNSPLKFTCSECNKEYSQSWKAFKRSNSGRCKDCNSRQLDNLEFIKEEIEETGAKLLSELYSTTKDDLLIECKDCKKTYTQKYYQFKNAVHKGYCRDCMLQIKKHTSTKFEYDSVKDIIESTGAKLLSRVYVGSHDKLKISCKTCNEEYSQSLNVFQTSSNSGNCPECNFKIGDNKKRYSINVLKEYFKEYDVTLLSDIYINQDEPLKILCKSCNHKYLQSLMNFKKARLKGICNKCNNLTSSSEIELQEYVKSLYTEVIFNDRKTIQPLELDIYIPEKNMAIEFDGLYWHSELNGKSKNYHLDKTLKCEEKGIQLLHVFENEWLYKKDIVKSIIRSKLNLNQTVYARKCQIKEVDLKSSNSFLEENHLQGKDKSSVRLGLFYEGQLVSLMTFGKSRYDKKVEWEMLRFCNKLNTSVTGGASKLFKYFNNQFSPKTLVTYADKRYSSGRLYDTLGFKFSHDSKPSYFYFNKNELKLFSRLTFQKHKLSKLLNDFRSNLTERENMKNNGYYRIWDCGNKVYRMNI